MNEVVKAELEKIRVPMSDYDDNTTFIRIPKQGNNELIINRSYIIKVQDYIVNEPAGFTLSSNWNKGVKPETNYLFVQVLNKLGTMMQFNAWGYDIRFGNTIENMFYEGLWLPIESIEIIKSF